MRSRPWRPPSYAWSRTCRLCRDFLVSHARARMTEVQLKLPRTTLIQPQQQSQPNPEPQIAFNLFCDSKRPSGSHGLCSDPEQIPLKQVFIALLYTWFSSISAFSGSSKVLGTLELSRRAIFRGSF